MNKKTIEDIDVRGKRVLVRVDFNVPLDADCNVQDDTRIVAALPTIQYLVTHGAKVILCSHLGRPKGKINPKMSLRPVAQRLQEHLPEVKVTFVGAVLGETVKNLVATMRPGDIVMLENLRFYAQEEANDPAFAKELASLADVFVSDAFGTVHRAHASTAGVAAFLPAVAGLLIGRELEIMGGAMENPAHPCVAILGGAKVADKINLIKNLFNKCDILLIGGGMAYTFYKAHGWGVGDSPVDDHSIELAQSLIREAEKRGVELEIPKDNVIATEFSPLAETKIVASNEIPEGWMGMDIGPETSALYADIIRKAGTVIWNGPMGVFEMEPFAKGTFAIAQALAENGGVTIVGGGDSASAVKKTGLSDRITHISTGGGASLEFLEGRDLPGVSALDDKEGAEGGKKNLFAGNWKMNLLPEEGVALAQSIVEAAKDVKDEVVICPPFVSLPAVAEAVRGSNVKLGAQNVHWEQSGAFTGEVSADMLKALGVEYVIIGHSERRQYFGETDQTVNARIKAALAAELVPIVCVGETLEQRQQGKTHEVLSAQVGKALAGLSKEQVKSLVVAYEPIWAIGTGHTATPEQAVDAITDIRATVHKLYQRDTADSLRVLYGGSMNEKNAAELMAMPQINGGLIGGASLKEEKFSAVLHYKQQ